MLAPLALLFAVTVTQDAAVRASCDATETTVATIPAGTEVEIRFAVSDGSNCYKVAANVAGTPVSGYVNGSALSNTNSFDQQRRGGTSLDGAGQAAATKRAIEPLRGGEHADIVRLLESHQPAAALERIEPLLKVSPRDPNLLLMASVASYQSDDLRRASGYCKDALAAKADDSIAAFCGRVEHESAADKSGQKLYGLRVALRYEGESMQADVAHAMVAMLDDEFIRISNQLGCTADERITAIVQSRAAYLATTGAAEWSGGQFDGRIHISLSDTRELGANTRRTFAHEIVHACLANIGSFPAWLHEGLAQKYSGDTLSAAARSQLQTLIQRGSVPKLENIDQNWSHLSSEHARLAYNLALAAADALVENYASYGIRNILRNPQMLRQITPEIDKTLGL